MTDKSLPDDDYTLTEGGAWFTVGKASVRISSNEDGVWVAIYPLGREAEDADAEAWSQWADLEVDLYEGD